MNDTSGWCHDLIQRARAAGESLTIPELRDGIAKLDLATIEADCVAQNDRWYSFPAFLLFVTRIDSHELASFEKQLRTLLDGMSPAARKDLLQLLYTQANADVRGHAGRVFDIATRLRTMVAGVECSYDVKNGARDVDIVCHLPAGAVALELKAVSDTDDQLNSFPGFDNLEARLVGTDIDASGRAFLNGLTSKVAPDSKLHGPWPFAVLGLSISPGPAGMGISADHPSIGWKLDAIAAGTETRFSWADYPWFAGVFLFDHTRYSRWVPNPEATPATTLPDEAVDVLVAAFETRLPIERAINGYA